MIAVQKGDTTVVMADNNEKSFQDGASLGKFGIGTIGAVNIFDTAAATYNSVKNLATKSGVEKTALVEGTKKAGIQATTDQARIAAEVKMFEMGGAAVP